MNLNSLMIGSPDPKPLTEYYGKLFGEPSWDQDAFTGWRIGSGGIVIGPHDEVSGKNAHPGRLIWNIETPDVKGEFERLKEAGAIVIKEPYQPDPAADMWIATLSDPDDNYFQLVSPM